MDKLGDMNDKKITIRVPSKLHKVLKACSYYTDISLNQLMLEIIFDGIPKWAEDNITVEDFGFDGISGGSTDEEVMIIQKSIEDAIKDLKKDFENYYMTKHGPD